MHLREEKDMNFEDVISKLAGDLALKRSANIQKDFRGQVSKESLIAQKKLFLDEKRISEEYHRYDENYDFQRLLLYVFLTKENYAIKNDFQVLVDEIKAFREYLTKKEKYMQFNEKEREIYEVVLETILSDKKTSEDEMKVLEKLQKKLNINTFQHWLLKIRNDFFDEVNNIETLSNDKISAHLRDLEKKGLLFNIETEEGKFYIIPDEIADKLKNIYGLELQDHKYEELLDNFVITNKDKLRFLKSAGIDARGDSNKLDSMIIANRLKPSEFLDSLSNASLHRILTKVGDQTSGTKRERIKRIVKHFDQRYVATQKIKDQREVLYKFYEELAYRNQPELISKGIIKRGEEVGSRFEEATEYLFEKVLGLNLQNPAIKGRRHSVKADGKAIKDGNFIVWDCKTKNDYFTMSTNERRQFIDYIRDYKKSDKDNFISFLIITNDIKDRMDVRNQLTDIKAETGVDISVIKASDLKKFAEKLTKVGIDVDLKKMLYTTRILDCEYLESLCTS